MSNLEEDQKALRECIGGVIKSNVPADEAASQVFEDSRWTGVRPDLRSYSVISFALKTHLFDFIESRITSSSSVFKAAQGDLQTGSQTLLILLKVAFGFYKLIENSGIKQGDEPGYSFASLIRALPFEMLQEIVSITPIDEVADCVEVLYEAMSGIERVNGVPCLGPFAYACSMLQSKVVESEGEEQLGRIVRWMFRHLPDGYKPALNIAHNINMSHPVAIGSVEDSMLDSLGNPVDKEQYNTFWTLQHSLYDGSVLYDGDKWVQCVQQIECVLKACSGPTQVEGSAALKTASEGTVAYLSSPSLLTLQLQDVTFRRQQLVQVAMLLHYAQSCSLISNKASKLRPPLPRIQEDCKLLQQRVLELLKATGSDGVAFEVGLRNALQLEIGDIRRKADLTQPKPKTPAVKEENKPTKKERSSMDTLDLTIKMCNKPWKAEAWPNLLYDATLLPEGLNSEGEICGTFPLDPMFGLEQEPLQDKMKKEMKTIVLEMERPLEEKRIADPMFQWRTLRMLARSNLKIYSECITERNADLQYAACKFLENETEFRDTAQKYLNSLPPTIRERRKEAKRGKASKKANETTRKRPGHDTDSGNASQGTPAKKARMDSQAGSMPGEDDHTAAPGTTASPLSAPSAGEIPSTDPALVTMSKTSEKGKEVVREAVTRDAVRAAKRDATEKETIRSSLREARDEGMKHVHADVKRSSQRTGDGPGKVREDDLHTGARERKGAERHVSKSEAGRQDGPKAGASEPAQNVYLGDRGKGDGGGLPGPPPGAVRQRDGHHRAPLVVPSQRPGRVPEGRNGRDRDEGDGDGGPGGQIRDGVRGQPVQEYVDRSARGAVDQRRPRDGTGGMRGVGEPVNPERDGDRIGLSRVLGSKHDTTTRAQSRMLSNAVNSITHDAHKNLRGSGGTRGTSPASKHPESGREKSGTMDLPQPTKRGRGDVRGDVSQYAANTGGGGRPGGANSRYDRPAGRKKA